MVKAVVHQAPSEVRQSALMVEWEEIVVMFLVAPSEQSQVELGAPSEVAQEVEGVVVGSVEQQSAFAMLEDTVIVGGEVVGRLR